MSDPKDEREPSEVPPPSPARPSKPTPVAHEAGEAARRSKAGPRRRETGPTRRGHDASKPEPEGGKPTPVRALASAGAPADVPADVEEVAFETAGEKWRVRVLGRSGGGSKVTAPLLLLGFWLDGTEDVDATREALVVAQSLSELTLEDLDDAFEASDTPPDPNRRRRFFGEVAARRRS